jgi:DNA-directed RNA polymerase subunit RPC12/RpoP
MLYADYKCEDCEKVFEISKKSIMDDFPEKGELECPECKSTNTYRTYDVVSDVSAGLLGNGKNAYDKGFTYQYSTLTGKAKGTRVKTY